jgi:hypothetical protein
MIKAINFFDDPQQVIADSKPYMDRYLDSIYAKGELEDSGKRLIGDESDQIQNSPMVDGMEKVDQDYGKEENVDNKAK